MQSDFVKLQQVLNEIAPASGPKITNFPSGAVMLDFLVEGEGYVYEYLPSLGYGISKVSRAVFGWEGVEHQFKDFESGRRFLLNMLKKSLQTGGPMTISEFEKIFTTLHVDWVIQQGANGKIAGAEITNKITKATYRYEQDEFSNQVRVVRVR